MGITVAQNELHPNQSYYYQPAYRGYSGTVETKFIAGRFIGLAAAHVRFSDALALY